jgi:Transposase DDE domain group 1
MGLRRIFRRVIEARFDGGSMTSDAGVVLLSQTTKELGLTQAASRCIADPRNPELITREVRDMLRQRVYELGGVVTRNTRRIRLYLASNWPSAAIFVQTMRALQATSEPQSARPRDDRKLARNPSRGRGHVVPSPPTYGAFARRRSSSIMRNCASRLPLDGWVAVAACWPRRTNISSSSSRE